MMDFPTCPHCGKDLIDRNISPEKRWFYLKKLIGQYYDSSSPIGQSVLTILAAVSQLQSMFQSEKVKQGLLIARENGRIGGRPRRGIPEEIFQRIQEMKVSGASWRTIESELKINRRTLRRRFRELIEKEPPTEKEPS